MKKRTQPNETFTVVKPSLDGNVELYEYLTGRKVSPERRAELALKYADTLAALGEEPPKRIRH